MTASKFLVVPILTCILLLVDWYVWQAVKVVVKKERDQTRTAVKGLYLGVSIVMLLGLWAYNFIDPDLLGIGMRTSILSGLFVTYGAKLLVVVVMLVADAFR